MGAHNAQQISTRIYINYTHKPISSTHISIVASCCLFYVVKPREYSPPRVALNVLTVRRRGCRASRARMCAVYYTHDARWVIGQSGTKRKPPSIANKSRACLWRCALTHASRAEEHRTRMQLHTLSICAHMFGLARSRCDRFDVLTCVIPRCVRSHLKIEIKTLNAIIICWDTTTTLPLQHRRHETKRLDACSNGCRIHDKTKLWDKY